VTLSTSDPAAIRRLAADLAAARYTVDRLRSLWGDEAAAALERGNRVPALRALDRRDDPAATLATVLLLGLPVPAAALDAALPTVGSAGASDLGIVALDGDRALPAVDLRPYAFVDARGAGEWWIASDLGELATGGALRTDHVLGVGGASVTLSGLLLPGPYATALDLGTGCGIQALHLARDAERVVATDISERALEFARFNAALNGVSTIEFRLGSLFEPVAGERFDRIASNPPFVITPRGDDVPAYEYRDGGLVGDGIVEAMVRGAADHLVRGGIAQLLGNWEDRERPGLDRAQGWADAVGLDAWIVQRDRLDPARYAETWIRDGGTLVASPAGADLVGSWLDDFAARGVVGVGVGYVLLRRPPGAPTLRRAERLDAPIGDGAAGLGSHLAESLAAHDRVAGLADAELADSLLAVAPDVTEERSHWPGEEHPSVIVLRQGGGFHREVRADPGLAAIVGACDGDLPLGAIVAAVADLLEVDADALRAAVLPAVRELLVDGILRFAD
jgi:methylase of polypeptide subunit release factors